MNFIEKESLSAYSNFKIGGPARFFFPAKNEGEISAALKEAGNSGLPVFVLGGGTNILFSDSGFDGLVIKPEIKMLRRERDMIIAGAGVFMSELLNFTAENNLSGLEWAGGLPGTLGGAIRGNAGCFNGEIKDSVSTVRSINRDTHEVLERNNAECDFGYRDSVFKKDAKEIILETVLLMKPGEKDKILSSANEKIEYRKTRQPGEYPNIGSIFKNVPVEKFKNGLTEELKTHVKTDPFSVVPAAVLISQAGLKSRQIGGAQVSEKHANFIINIGDAKAADVLALIEVVKKEVSDKFGVQLEPEIEFVGHFD